MAALSTLSRVSSSLHGDDGHRSWGRRLRRRLVDAGPLGAGFGIHLGSRIDLLAGTDCVELLAIPDVAPASDPGLVGDLVDRELGGQPERILDDFDPRPFESGLLFQWHSARLAGGTSATLQLVHPELVPQLLEGRLEDLVERLVGAGEFPFRADAAVDEFMGGLDLARASEVLRTLSEETTDSAWLEIPDISHSSRWVRVLSALRGDQWQGSAPADARRISRIWHAMVLRGDLFPVQPWGRGVSVSSAGRVLFSGGEWNRLPRGSRGDLREYLAAVAAREPARAAEAFLDLLPRTPRHRRLRDAIRHCDPFRDQGWDIGGDLFARQVLAHWRSAAELGFAAPPSLLPFYRGLFLLNQEADRRAGDTASVRNGFREARLLALFGELNEDGELRRLSGRVERQVGLMSGLPYKLNRILTLVSEDDRLEDEIDGRAGDPAETHRGGVWAAVCGCLLAISAVALLTHRFGGAGALGFWAERIGAGVVLLLGALLLRVATRR
jgi:hypothetical protein